MPPLRLFVAINTPPEITPHIAAIRDTVKTCRSEVTWEPDAKLHATLKFLGDTPDQLLPEIVSSIERVSEEFAPLEIRYAGIGCFPDHRRPRVVWIGVEEATGTLRALHYAIEDELHMVGGEREDRPFHAHVTIGRVRSHKNIQQAYQLTVAVFDVSCLGC